MTSPQPRYPQIYPPNSRPNPFAKNDQPFVPPEPLKLEIVTYGDHLFDSLEPLFDEQDMDDDEANDFFDKLVLQRMRDLDPFIRNRAERIHLDGGRFEVKSLNILQGILNLELDGSCKGCSMTAQTLGPSMNMALAKAKQAKGIQIGLDGKPRLAWMEKVEGTTSRPQTVEDLQQSIAAGRGGFKALSPAAQEQLALPRSTMGRSIEGPSVG